MKSASDAILRPDQATYLDALHATSVHALAALGGLAAAAGRDPLLARMEARAAERRYPISDPEVACLLAALARIARPRLVVELGTNIGYGAIVLARGAGEGARVVTIEYRADLVEEARGFIAEAGLEGRVEVRHGMAIPELRAIAEPIDLLYVDCVKEEYPEYLRIGVEKLAPRGVIVADNVLWRGQVARETPIDEEKERALALRAFNLALVSRPELCGVVLPLGDGVGLAVRI
ncbi:MAG: O-methyltransferase [Myxococcales bacterium]|nr:O-methyltransferase [Myxococcales bacterium]